MQIKHNTLNKVLHT